MKHNALSLAIGMALLAAARTPARADVSAAQALEELENRLTDLSHQAQTIRATADAENRSMTEAEQAELRSIFASFDAVQEEVESRRRIEQLAGATAVARVPDATAAAGGEAVKPNTPARRGAQEPRVEAVSQPRGQWGWRSFSEFAAALVRAGNRSAPTIDPRLTQAAATTYGQEGVGADGGFLVPPDFRTTIMKKVQGEESLLSRTDQQTTGSNTLVVPKDETTPWQTTGGIQAYWEGEANTLTQSKLKVENLSTKLNKLTALIPVTEELLEDASALGSYLSSKVPDKMDYRVQDAIMNGTGAGMPLGILNSAATISVAAQSGQAADTIEFRNIVDMWTRMYSPCKQRAVWLINGDVEAQLINMRFPGNSGNIYPVYLPPGGLSAAPYGSLMGRPVIPLESLPALGDAGDIALVDLSTYLSVIKTGGVRQDVSVHMYFDQDITAFRFILRIGGQPWWSGPVTRAAAGASSRSCFVKLAAR